MRTRGRQTLLATVAVSAVAVLAVAELASPAVGARRVKSAHTGVTDATPYGVPLQSAGKDDAIMLDGKRLTGTARLTDAQMSYALLNRTTLQWESGTVSLDTRGLDDLLKRVKEAKDNDEKDNTPLNHLLVFNWSHGGDFGGRLNALFKEVGGRELDHNLAGSVIGIPGAAAGGAFLNQLAPGQLAPLSANMSGYLRVNNTLPNPRYDFIFTDSFCVDSAPPEKQTNTETTIVVGSLAYTQTPACVDVGHAYSQTHAPGASGFEYLRLDTKTLAPQANSVYTTNSGNPVQDAAQVKLLAEALTLATTQPDRPLVILQSFGSPSGSSTDWERAATAIEKLGGTRQVFDALNQPSAGPLDPDSGRRGGYAVIGRVGSTAPSAEVSYPLTGRPARLEGLLMRSRTADFEPTLVSNATTNQGGPNVPVNEELVQIVNARPGTPPSASFPKLASPPAAEFLGRDVMKVCQPIPAPCDVRKTYYTDYSDDWGAIAGKLQNAEGKCQAVNDARFTVDKCQEVRTELIDEALDVQLVKNYVKTLQEPFGTGTAAGLAEIQRISQEIFNAVQPRAADNTTSNVLTLISYVAKLGTFLKAAGPIASGISAGFALTAYLTRHNGEPDLIGPAVKTEASKLGVELAERYKAADAELEQIGRIIVSDHGKLTAFVSKRGSDPNWILGEPTAAKNELQLAAKQMIYQHLFPLGWPVMHVFVPEWGSAHSWYCLTYGGYKHYLFRNEPDGAQMIQRVNGTKAPIAVGGKYEGVKDDVRAPSAALAEQLFSSPDRGGIGLFKLEFFSQQNGFRYESVRGIPSDPAGC